MIQNNSRLRHLLKAYADNRCTREELDELFRLVSSSKQNGEFTQVLEEIWHEIPEAEKLLSINENELFGKITERTTAIKSSAWFAWTRVAAVLFIVACAGVMYFILSPAEPQSTAQIPPAATGHSSASHRFIQLPDGSTVLLNTNSTLQFPDSFAGKTREVVLSGEAFFDIDSDPSRPFIIHTGKVQTKVLGTAFNIRAYPDEEDVTVTVTKGKVRVDLENKTLGVITPNQQISVNKSSNAMVQQAVLADSVITWKENDVVFDNVTFEEAAFVIEKRYNVQITFENPNLKKCRFHASFLNENDVNQVLTVLCDLNKATFRINNSQVVISGEGCE